MKLFRLLLVLMLAISIVPTAMVGWTSISRTRELLVRDAQELAQERVKQLQMKVSALVEQPSEAVIGLARVSNFFQLEPPLQRSHIVSILKQRTDVSVVTLFSPDLRRIPGLQGFAVKDIAPSEIATHEAKAQALLPGLVGLTYSDVYLTESRHVPSLTAVYSVGDPVRGYVATEISLLPLRAMLDRERSISNRDAYVVDSRGRLVAGSAGGALVLTSLADRPAVAHLLGNPAATGLESIHVGAFGSEDGERVVAAYARIPTLGWAVISEQPVRQAYSQVAALERQMALGMLGALVVALALAWLSSRYVAKPLKKFEAIALEIAKGKFGGQIDYRSSNELGELAATINYMSAQIEAYDFETRRLYEALESGYLETIVALANSIDSKDAYTRGHSQRVGDLSVEIGREMGLTQMELKQLHYGGILHDIGKIGIVESILCKKTPLTPDEMLTMREHPTIGDAIIQPVSFLTSVRAAVRNHHERWDGNGYPDQLKGDKIPLVARIVNCADTFDACTSTRPYQKAMPVERALEVLDKLRGTQLDPGVLDALRRALAKKGHQVSLTPSAPAPTVAPAAPAEAAAPSEPMSGPPAGPPEPSGGGKVVKLAS